MRISDWSSDVCSSDLPRFVLHRELKVFIHHILATVETHGGFPVAVVHEHHHRLVFHIHYGHVVGGTFHQDFRPEIRGFRLQPILHRGLLFSIILDDFQRGPVGERIGVGHIFHTAAAKHRGQCCLPLSYRCVIFFRTSIPFRGGLFLRFPFLFLAFFLARLEYLIQCLVGLFLRFPFRAPFHGAFSGFLHFLAQFL